VATAQEYDSLAINAAPPQGVDSAYMSQLMIVLATKALIKRERAKYPPLLRDTLVATSSRLGNEEHALNEKVATTLYGSGEGSEGEAISDSERALFVSAAAALTEAERDLAVAQPDTALPPEIVALNALEKARKARRLYLRGAPPAIVVNIDRVRMKGTERPEAGPRTPGAPDTLRSRMAARFVAAVGAMERGPRGSAEWRAGVDSLTILRVTAISNNPSLAGALSDAVTALDAGGDPAPALARARQAIIGSPAVSGRLSAWGGP
jgi:hypothetical protein